MSLVGYLLIALLTREPGSLSDVYKGDICIVCRVLEVRNDIDMYLITCLGITMAKSGVETRTTGCQKDVFCCLMGTWPHLSVNSFSLHSHQNAYMYFLYKNVQTMFR